MAPGRRIRLARLLLLLPAMSITKIAGLVLLVAAAVLLFLGVQATGTIGEKITDGVTGHYTHATMQYFVAGGIAGAVAVGLLIFGRAA